MSPLVVLDRARKKEKREREREREREWREEGRRLSNYSLLWPKRVNEMVVPKC
jgi:hypothetical protein